MGDQESGGWGWQASVCPQSGFLRRDKWGGRGRTGGGPGKRRTGLAGVDLSTVCLSSLLLLLVVLARASRNLCHKHTTLFQMLWRGWEAREDDRGCDMLVVVNW